jgi:hypothetical protein
MGRNDGFRSGLGTSVASLIEYAANKAELYQQFSNYLLRGACMNSSSMRQAKKCDGTDLEVDFVWTWSNHECLADCRYLREH